MKDFLIPIQNETTMCDFLPIFRLNPITNGFSDQRLLTSFWTHGTIIDQFIVKGVHQ